MNEKIKSSLRKNR